MFGAMTCLFVCRKSRMCFHCKRQHQGSPDGITLRVHTEGFTSLGWLYDTGYFDAWFLDGS